MLDAWSRKIVGPSMANHLRAELVLDAMEAAGQRRPKDVIHVCSPDGLREQLDQVSGKMTLLWRLAALRPGPLTSTLASAKACLRAIARSGLLLNAEIKQHEPISSTHSRPHARFA